MLPSYYVSFLIAFVFFIVCQKYCATHNNFRSSNLSKALSTDKKLSLASHLLTADNQGSWEALQVLSATTFLSIPLFINRSVCEAFNFNTNERLLLAGSCE